MSLRRLSCGLPCFSHLMLKVARQAFRPERSMAPSICIRQEYLAWATRMIGRPWRVSNLRFDECRPGLASPRKPRSSSPPGARVQLRQNQHRHRHRRHHWYRPAQEFRHLLKTTLTAPPSGRHHTHLTRAAGVVSGAKNLSRSTAGGLRALASNGRQGRQIEGPVARSFIQRTAHEHEPRRSR